MQSNQGESPKGSGRKNIRKLMTKHELAAATKAAAKEEEERRKRIAARQKLVRFTFVAYIGLLKTGQKNCKS